MILINRYDIQKVLPDENISTFMIMMSRNANPVYRLLKVNTTNRGRKIKELFPISHYDVNEIYKKISEKLRYKPTHPQAKRWKLTLDKLNKLKQYKEIA